MPKIVQTQNFASQWKFSKIKTTKTTLDNLEHCGIIIDVARNIYTNPNPIPAIKKMLSLLSLLSSKKDCTDAKLCVSTEATETTWRSQTF
jgi:hypothetical protein